MGSESTIVTFRNNREGFLKILDAANNPKIPSGAQYDLESRYRKEECGEGFADLSFLILKGNVIQAYVFCHKYGFATGFNGSGAEIGFVGTDKSLVKAVLDTLLAAGAEYGLTNIHLADTSSTQTLGSIGLESYNRGGVPACALRAQIDLEQKEDKIHADLRKSYKSLVNKGRTEIEFKYITRENPDENLYCDFENFHLKIAGRKTRSNESWNTHFDMIKAGEAELLMGFLPFHGLVSSALFIDFGPTTTYAVAVYDRDLFDRPLAHCSVYEGLLRAKKRGQSLFNLGIMPTPGKASDKELSIAKFKKGFVPSLTALIEWTIPVSDTIEDIA